jgi:hypothetical protein
MGVVVRAQERAGGREAVCACVVEKRFSRGGFARSVEGMCAYVKSSGVWAAYRSGSWELGNVRGTSLVLGGVQVVGSRRAPIADPSGGTSVDSQARTAVGEFLAALRQHGLIET